MRLSVKFITGMLSLLLLLTCSLSGCSSAETTVSDTDSQKTNLAEDSNIQNSTTISDYFSDRDFETTYDESTSVHITLQGDSASCSSNAVQITGSTVTITDEGTYIISGTLNDGMIIINSEKTDKTQLVLNGVDIHSETSAPLYILQSDKVFITTADGTTNTLSNGGTFTAIDENNIDAVIYSKEDLTLNGSGSLVITSPAGHGIVSKDSLVITGGSYDINCASSGLSGKDNVCIADGTFTIVSGKDGIHAENADDTSLGYIYIQGGNFHITSEGDGVSAAFCLRITDGQFDITSGGGNENASSHSSSSWGNFMGGGKHQDGKGNKPNGKPSDESPSAATTSDTDDSTSMKGLKASSDLMISGGTFLLNTADDAVHSNASVTVNGGTFEIASGDDAFHADDTLTITAGTILITESYEGLEGLHVLVTGGDITLICSDDGINAAGGTDTSGYGGRDAVPGHGPSSSKGSITISGGTINITASGDGIDANGTLEITDGFIIVCGPTQGDTATLDYDISGTISGGTFIGTGAASMAQTFSDANQGVISVKTGNQKAGTVISLSDDNGNTILSHTPDLDFAVVILSSPDIVSGKTYTLTIGSLTQELTAY